MIPNLADRRLYHDKKLFRKGMLLSFCYAALAAAVIFLPFVIKYNGIFVYAGDYVGQQIPFYYYVQGYIRDFFVGNNPGTWSWATDLGSSVINSYSFYNIGSIFLWITVIFPQAWMPYLMVPLFILKFGCISAAAYIYLSRYAKTMHMTVIVSIIYAFCGFNVYNIFFNHMLDPVVIFPLMLWALDGFMLEKKRGPFALFVGLALLNSYFFFIGNAVFILLYFVVKLVTKEYRITLKEFALLAFEVMLGVGIGMILALPACLNLVQNYRTSEFADGMGLVLYGKVQQYFHILTSALVPPDPPWQPNLFQDGSIKWTSMSAFLPVVSLSGVIAFCRARKRNFVKYMMAICLVMALVPILNSSFYGFNERYYARWVYMPILMMCLATLKSLEDRDIDLKKGVRAVLILTGIYAIFGLLPTKVDDTWTLGAAEYPDRFWLTVFVAILGLSIFYLLLRFVKNKKRFTALLLVTVLLYSAVYSIIHLAMGVPEQSNYIDEQVIGTQQLNLPDDEFYRLDAYISGDEDRTYANIGLWTDKSTIQAWNSVVTPSIMEFYPFVGVKRDVSSKPQMKEYALRGLLSVRYTVVRTSDIADFKEEKWATGWRLVQEGDSLSLFEYENFVPMGFTYENFVTIETLESMPKNDRAPMMMRAIGLDEKQAAQYAYLFESELDDSAPLGYERYVADCDDRRASSADNFSANAGGFTANIKLKKDNLVFFSVPYDEGFSATVNGSPAEVMKVSGGMMAVFAPGGDNEIVFSYQTPGFSAGRIISAVSFGALLLYCLVSLRYKKSKKHSHLPENNEQ